MATPLQGTSGSRGLTGLGLTFGRPVVRGKYVASNPVLASLQRIPQDQSTSHQLKRLIQSVERLQLQSAEESSVTKEQIDSLAKSLDELRLGMDDGEGAHALQAMQGDTLLTAVGRVEDKLRDMADRIGKIDSTGSSNGKLLSELVNEIRAIVKILRPPTSAPATPGEGELPPPAPKVFFGRSKLVDTIVDLTQRLTSIALTGTGGIGKTSVALAVLNDDRVKRRFGNNRSFIRCDQLTPSHTHFLRKLSEVTGAGVENPEDLSPLRSYLSSKDMIIVLDNAESILGLPETSAQGIHRIVDELSQFSNICLAITSRISNSLPAHCEIIEIPTLSMEAGQEMFYRIYKHSGRSDEINEILEELEFHPLSLTLLATVAQQNRWTAKRLRAEWERQRTGVLRTRNLGSLAATIELSLQSSMFQELGPDAREVLEIVAFFPQGVNEDNVEGLFPTIPDGGSMFDTFCNLSLTHHNNGLITMLAPLRDHLRPKDPMASPLLRAAKEYYFKRLSINLIPGKPGFEESKWIASEDVNVEHLLDVFTSIDAESESVWEVCNRFMDHLFWHKPRLVILGPKVEALPDRHPSKPECFYFLSRLFDRVGNQVDQKRVLVHSLGLWRKRRDGYRLATTLTELADVNRKMGLYKEGIRQARQASQIFGPGLKDNQAQCLTVLVWLLRQDGQFDAAEEAAFRAMDFSQNQYDLYQCHRALGEIHRSKGNAEKAVHHFETSLQIASSLNSPSQLSNVHESLAELYAVEGKFNDVHTHIELAKSHTGNDIFLRGQVLFTNACLLCAQRRYEEGIPEALGALAIFEKLGAVDAAEKTREALERMKKSLSVGSRW